MPIKKKWYQNSRWCNCQNIFWNNNTNWSKIIVRLLQCNLFKGFCTKQCPMSKYWSSKTHGIWKTLFGEINNFPWVITGVLKLLVFERLCLKRCYFLECYNPRWSIVWWKEYQWRKNNSWVLQSLLTQFCVGNNCSAQRKSSLELCNHCFFQYSRKFTWGNCSVEVTTYQFQSADVFTIFTSIN